MADANAYLGPAELHGMLCGFICHGDLVPEPGCMDLILNDADEHEYEQLIKQIKLLFSLSLQQLSDFGFEFELLLLDDDCQFVELAVIVLHLKLSQFLILCLPKALEERNRRRLREALLLSVEELVLLDVFANAVNSELPLCEVAPGEGNPVDVHQGLETFTNISRDELAFA